MGAHVLKARELFTEAEQRLTQASVSNPQTTA
jgi:hypothetical protein